LSLTLIERIILTDSVHLYGAAPTADSSPQRLDLENILPYIPRGASGRC
jgi:hypothetical protein